MKRLLGLTLTLALFAGAGLPAFAQGCHRYRRVYYTSYYRPYAPAYYRRVYYVYPRRRVFFSYGYYHHHHRSYCRW